MRFRYFTDPLCLAACVAYVLNRWIVKPLAGPGFWHDYFNDLLLIPAALPLLLAVNRVFGLRRHDGVPTLPEICGHLLLWSVICEVVGPRLTNHGTADPKDVLAYTIGAVLAALWWQLPRRNAELT